MKSISDMIVGMTGALLLILQISLAGASSSVGCSIPSIYADSWTEYTEHQIELSRPFHAKHEVVEKVVKAHMACVQPMSNTAIFGVSIYNSEDSRIDCISYGKVISSGRCKSCGVEMLNAKDIISGDIKSQFLGNIAEISPFFKPSSLF